MNREEEVERAAALLVREGIAIRGLALQRLREKYPFMEDGQLDSAVTRSYTMKAEAQRKGANDSAPLLNSGSRPLHKPLGAGNGNGKGRGAPASSKSTRRKQRSSADGYRSELRCLVQWCPGIKPKLVQKAMELEYGVEFAPASVARVMDQVRTLNQRWEKEGVPVPFNPSSLGLIQRIVQQNPLHRFPSVPGSAREPEPPLHESVVPPTRTVKIPWKPRQDETDARRGAIRQYVQDHPGDGWLKAIVALEPHGADQSTFKRQFESVQREMGLLPPRITRTSTDPLNFPFEGGKLDAHPDGHGKWSLLVRAEGLDLEELTRFVTAAQAVALERYQKKGKEEKKAVSV